MTPHSQNDSTSQSILEPEAPNSVTGQEAPAPSSKSREHKFALWRWSQFEKLIAHIPPGQFLRYLTVGAWNTLFGYSTYALFTALLMPRMRFGYILASVFSSSINITVAYLGYKFFVFKTKGNYLREWFRCILVYGSGMLPGLVLLPLLVEGLHYGFHLQRSAPYIGGALLMGIGVIYSFLGHKHFTFRTRPVAAGDASTQRPRDMRQAMQTILGKRER